MASFFEISAQTAKDDVVNFSAPITIYISSGQKNMHLKLSAQSLKHSKRAE